MSDNEAVTLPYDMNAQNASEELAQMESAHSTQDTERKMSPV